MTQAVTDRFLIRSMSTTDYDPRSNQPVIPYHIYLMSPEKRGRAYWSRSKADAAIFPTEAAALAERARILRPGDRSEVTPFDDSGLPTYWESQKAREDAKKVAAAQTTDDRHQQIARKLLTDIVDAGCMFSIYDGGEWVVRRSVDVEAGLAAMFTSDEDVISVRRLTGEQVGQFDLLHGNEPWELIADYSDTAEMRAIIAGADALGDLMEQASPVV